MLPFVRWVGGPPRVMPDLLSSSEAVTLDQPFEEIGYILQEHLVTTWGFNQTAAYAVILSALTTPEKACSVRFVSPSSWFEIMLQIL